MYAGTSGTGDGDPWGTAGMEATFPLAFQGISHFSLLKHMVFFLITAATPHWERGKDACIGPSFAGGGGRRGRGKKKRRVSPSPGLGGCCQLLLLSSLACVRPSPQWPWSIVCGSQEGDWSPLSLGTPESGSCFPVPAQRKRLPCFTEGIREGGARCTKFC